MKEQIRPLRRQYPTPDPTPTPTSVQDGTLQRSPAPTETQTVYEVPSIVHEVLSSSGQPLDAQTRTFMEPRFSHDFSQVRIHTDERAVQSAQAVDALAYTVGQDVVFGAGQYAPASTIGKRLLAHELTHVVQQASGPVTGPPVSGGYSISDLTDTTELAAETTASNVMAQATTPPMASLAGALDTDALGASGITIQRFQAGDTGHGGIEKEALTGGGTGLPANLQFTSDEVSKVYIGNWLRDLSQLPSKAFFLVNILALGEFGREINPQELGTYVASEHLDNPEGGGTVEDPKLTPEQREAEFKKLSSAQLAAYKDEQAHAADIQKAASESGLPIYIERGKYHAKQQLAEAVAKGRTPEGMQAMGDGLHAIEDYYSHSNFLEACVWYLHNNKQITDDQYTRLVTTEVGNDAALLGTMSVPQGGPQIITGTYAPGANATVSQLELLCTEVEHGQLTKAFIKGAALKLGITVEDIMKKASEGGRSFGQTVGGVVGGVLGGAVGGVGGAITGAGQGAAEGWREHSGFSALWHGFTGLFSGAASGAASGASQGWNTGESVGGAAGGAVGSVVGGALGLVAGLTLDAAIVLVGESLILAFFPAIAALLAAAIAAVKTGIVEKIAQDKTRQAAQDAQQAGLGPSHSELAKDDPQHHLFEIARALAVDVDRDIGKAMINAWDEMAKAQTASDQAGQSTPEQTTSVPQAPIPAITESVTSLVDKYVSHPATDLWWHDTVFNAIKP